MLLSLNLDVGFVAHHYREVVTYKGQLPKQVVYPKIVGYGLTDIQMIFYLLDPIFALGEFAVERMKKFGILVFYVRAIAKVFILRHICFFSKEINLYIFLQHAYDPKCAGCSPTVCPVGKFTTLLMVVERNPTLAFHYFFEIFQLYFYQIFMSEVFQ